MHCLYDPKLSKVQFAAGLVHCSCSPAVTYPCVDVQVDDSMGVMSLDVSLTFTSLPIAGPFKLGLDIQVVAAKPHALAFAESTNVFRAEADGVRAVHCDTEFMVSAIILDRVNNR